MSTEKTSLSPTSSSVVMRPEWLLAIAKAASSIRFTANNWDWLTVAAKNESLSIADILGQIESAFVAVQDEPQRCEKCGYTAEDETIHGDHHLCGGKIPVLSSSPLRRDLIGTNAELHNENE